MDLDWIFIVVSTMQEKKKLCIECFMGERQSFSVHLGWLRQSGGNTSPIAISSSKWLPVMEVNDGVGLNYKPCPNGSTSSPKQVLLC